MQLGSVEGFIFDLPDLPLLHQGYRTSEGVVFWSLQFLHHELEKHGYSKKPFKLMTSVQELAGEVPFLDALRDIIPKPPASDASKVPHHLATTASILTLVTAFLSRNQTEKVVKKACSAWASSFCDMCATVVKNKGTDLPLQSADDGTPVVLNRLGVTQGLHNKSRSVCK